MTIEAYSRSFYNKVASRADVASQISADIISTLFNVKSLADIGCGSGIWTRNFCLKLKEIETIYALDLELPERVYLDDASMIKCQVHHIAQNLDSNPLLPFHEVDLTICLEVLEHLESETAIELMIEFGKKTKYLLFSAAIPGQGGTHHINERPYEYWYSQLRENGFIPFDVVRPKLKGQDVPSYYKYNIIFWINTSKVTDKEIETIGMNPNKSLMSNPIDIRPLPIKIKYKMLSLIPHQYITKLSKVKRIFLA